jgi:hypothetical protein
MLTSVFPAPDAPLSEKQCFSEVKSPICAITLTSRRWAIKYGTKREGGWASTQQARQSLTEESSATPLIRLAIRIPTICRRAIRQPAFHQLE